MTEYIPIRDYYHRHSRSLFWEMKVRSFISTFSVSNLSKFYKHEQMGIEIYGERFMTKLKVDF